MTRRFSRVRSQQTASLFSPSQCRADHLANECHLASADDPASVDDQEFRHHLASADDLEIRYHLASHDNLKSRHKHTTPRQSVNATNSRRLAPREAVKFNGLLKPGFVIVVPRNEPAAATQAP